RRHTRFSRDWSSDVCSSDLEEEYTIKYISKDDFFHEFGDDLRYLKEFCKKKKKQYILFGRLLNNEEILEKLFKMGFRNFGVFNRSEERRVGKECRFGRCQCQ